MPTKDRKITVNKAEAECVRTIFRSYLKLGSLNLLMADLRKQGIEGADPEVGQNRRRVGDRRAILAAERIGLPP